MGKVKLSDIQVISQRRIETPGGDVLHGLKAGEKSFVGFGEIYFSWINKNSIKAWKLHTRMTMNLIVSLGNVRFVFGLKNSDGNFEFRIEEIGIDNYARITVPPGIWFGFKGLAASQSLITNIANIPHDETEVERLSKSKINYEWV